MWCFFKTDAPDWPVYVASLVKVQGVAKGLTLGGLLIWCIIDGFRTEQLSPEATGGLGRVKEGSVLGFGQMRTSTRLDRGKQGMKS